MSQNKLNQSMLALCEKLCVNIGDSDWDVFPVLGIYFGQEKNIFPGIFPGFCLFLRKLTFKTSCW